MKSQNERGDRVLYFYSHKGTGELAHLEGFQVCQWLEHSKVTQLVTS